MDQLGMSASESSSSTSVTENSQVNSISEMNDDKNIEIVINEPTTTAEWEDLILQCN